MLINVSKYSLFLVKKKIYFVREPAHLRERYKVLDGVRNPPNYASMVGQDLNHLFLRGSKSPAVEK